MKIQQSIKVTLNPNTLQKNRVINALLRSKTLLLNTVIYFILYLAYFHIYIIKYTVNDGQ